jgi:hypothetical protein
MMDANQAKADGNLKEMTAREEAKMEAIQAATTTDRELMLARMDANRAKTEANQERMNASLREEIKSGQAEMRYTVRATEEKMDAWIANMKDDRKETMACQVRTEACLHSKKTNPEGMESEMEHREVSTEEVAVKSSGTMKKRHKGRHLAAGRRG